MGRSVKMAQAFGGQAPPRRSFRGSISMITTEAGTRATTLHVEKSLPKSPRQHSNYSLQIAKLTVCPFHQAPHQGGRWNPLILPGDLPSSSCLLPPGPSLLQETRICHPNVPLWHKGHCELIIRHRSSSENRVQEMYMHKGSLLHKGAPPCVPGREGRTGHSQKDPWRSNLPCLPYSPDHLTATCSPHLAFFVLAKEGR